MNLHIRRTWHGGHADPAEHASLVVTPGPDLWRVDVDAPFHDDPPPTGPPGPIDRLWEHEVVELFVVGPGASPRYTEIELGPHGHYLILQLHGVRNPVRTLLEADYEVALSDGRWRGRLLIDAGLLPEPDRVNAFAIHGRGTERRYLACTPVPGNEPDFHRLSAFAPWPTQT